MRLFSPENVPSPPNLKPFDWKKTRGRKIVFEIGCGSGMHPYERAKLFPDEFVIAVERTRTKFSQFQFLLKNRPSLDNLEAIHADAIWWAASNFNKNYLFDTIFILYPNPYPKSKNANLRLVNMPFTQFLLEHLKPLGELIIATNMPNYFDEAVEGFQNSWGLSLTESIILPANFSARTLFEKKYLERGDKCFQAKFSK